MKGLGKELKPICFMRRALQLRIPIPFRGIVIAKDTVTPGNPTRPSLGHRFVRHAEDCV